MRIRIHFALLGAICSFISAMNNNPPVGPASLRNQCIQTLRDGFYQNILRKRLNLSPDNQYVSPNTCVRAIQDELFRICDAYESKDPKHAYDNPQLCFAYLKRLLSVYSLQNEMMFDSDEAYKRLINDRIRLITAREYHHCLAEKCTIPSFAISDTEQFWQKQDHDFLSCSALKGQLERFDTIINLIRAFYHPMYNDLAQSYTLNSYITGLRFQQLVRANEVPEIIAMKLSLQDEFVRCIMRSPEQQHETMFYGGALMRDDTLKQLNDCAHPVIQAFVRQEHALNSDRDRIEKIHAINDRLLEQKKLFQQIAKTYIPKETHESIDLIPFLAHIMLKRIICYELSHQLNQLDEKNYNIFKPMNEETSKQTQIILRVFEQYDRHEPFFSALQKKVQNHLNQHDTSLRKTKGTRKQRRTKKNIASRSWTKKETAHNNNNESQASSSAQDESQPTPTALHLCRHDAAYSPHVSQIKETPYMIKIPDPYHETTIALFKPKQATGVKINFNRCSRNIEQWLEDVRQDRALHAVDNALTLQGYRDVQHDNYTPDELNLRKMHAYHGFPIIVDDYAQQCAIKKEYVRKHDNKRLQMVCIAGALYFKDGSFNTGIFTYLIDPEDDQIFHRMFHECSGEKIVNEYQNNGIWDMQAIVQAAV